MKWATRFFGFSIFLCGVFFYTTAFGATIISNSDHSTATGSRTGDAWIQRNIYVPVPFTLKSFVYYTQATSCTGANLTIYNPSFPAGGQVSGSLGGCVHDPVAGTNTYSDATGIYLAMGYYDILFPQEYTAGLYGSTSDNVSGSLVDPPYYAWTGDKGDASPVVDASFAMCDDATTCSPTPPITTTRIQDITPADGSTTGSTSVVASANYYLGDPDTGQYLTAPLVIALRLHRTDGIGSPDQVFDFDSLTYNSLTAISHTFTLPTNTTWEMRFDLSGDGYYFISPLGTPTNFNVVSNPSTGTSGYTTCSITDIAGCMQNALVFLFYPSSASLSQYNGLYLQFINKPPFGYIVGIQKAISGINNTATPAFTLESMPILNTYIFDPIRTALVWVLWVAFAFVLYHRLKNIAI